VRLGMDRLGLKLKEAFNTEGTESAEDTEKRRI